MAYTQLEPKEGGLAAHLFDLLLCRWTYRQCCQKCWDCLRQSSSEEDIEILGPFPAPPPPWLLDERSDDRDGDSDLALSDTTLPSDTPLMPHEFPEWRRSSDASHFSFSRHLSRFESRRGSRSPSIDVVSLEAWATTAHKEIVQPLLPRRSFHFHTNYFCKIEPELYSVNSESDELDSLTDDELLSRYQLGSLHFSTQYDFRHGHLAVRIIAARDLPLPFTHDGSHQDMAHSNPYAKLCLLPDLKDSRQTSVKRKTQNPVFEERYTFILPYMEAQKRTLQITLVDFDKFSQHCVVGKVALPLCEMDLVKGGHWWKPLIPSTQNEVELGELLISLNFLPCAGRLNVEVIRAKQLLQTDILQGSDPFVKVQLVYGLKIVKTKKTTCLHGTIDPLYNESFSFKVLSGCLEDISLVFTVYGRNMKSSNDFVGRVVLGQFPSGSTEHTHWHRMTGLHRTPIQQWHSLRSRTECDRVSPASLIVT
uniref:Synaptotagmin-17 n=1 Tax=Eptatretus burgeri TaxID=7764 RepID=A0A8C4QU44_EPTBU